MNKYAPPPTANLSRILPVTLANLEQNFAYIFACFAEGIGLINSNVSPKMQRLFLMHRDITTSQLENRGTYVSLNIY